jgi:CPA2 family monovalent cation:H+ antiporter-2
MTRAKLPYTIYPSEYNVVIFEHFESLLITLGSAVLIVALLRRMHLPPILGYLLTGMVVGPHGLGLLETGEELNFIAEFGVVFLLFTIGLELSFPKLVSMRRSLLGLGGLQVLTCTALAISAAYYFGLPWPAIIAVAGSLALSSTAVVTKQLIEQDELHQEHGKLCLSILLFQDLAAVPFLIIVPSMADTQGTPLSEALLHALLMGGVVFVVMLAAGRWLLRPLFHLIAAAKSTELFMLTALLVVLASASLTEHLGLSLALGAFLAGVMLAETEYVHQIESDIEPFRDILLGLFFTTVGLIMNPVIAWQEWQALLLIVSSIILFKTVIITGVGYLSGASLEASIRTGLILAQGGEFGFALLALASSRNLIEEYPHQLVVTAIIISVVIAPFLIRSSGSLAKMLINFFGNKANAQPHGAPFDKINQGSQSNHVIVCGYGRVGQTLGRFLEHEAIGFIGLDLDPLRIREARAASEPVYFGDASDEAVLRLAGIEQARLLILAFDDSTRALKTLHHIRRVNKHLPILVRTTDDRHLEQLQLAGATEVISDKLESSLMLASHMLMLLGVPPEKAHQQVWEVKTNRYKMLHGYFHGKDDYLRLGRPGREDINLHAVELTASAFALGKTLEEFTVEKLPIQLASFCRNGYKCSYPTPHTMLQAGDVLVLLGTPEHLYLAEEKLLQG